MNYFSDPYDLRKMVFHGKIDARYGKKSRESREIGCTYWTLFIKYMECTDWPKS